MILKGAELGEHASASLNKAKGLREEASISQNKVDTLSKEKNSSESKAITISKELTQEVLEFIAHQPANPGPNGESGGQIGYKEARRILENGGAESAAYLKHFQEENPQYFIQSISVRGKEAALNTEYETQSQHYRNSAGIQAQNTFNIQGVDQHAKNAGFDKTRIEQTFFNPKEPENSQQKESSVKQAASQSSGQRINVGSLPSVQDNVQIQPQQSADSASTQTPSRVQSVQLGERDTGLEGRNLDKFHSRNTPFHQTHSDQAPLHSKQDANSSQESSVKQTAQQSNEQSISGKSTPSDQKNTDNAGTQAQTPSRAQSVQTERSVAGLDKGTPDKLYSSNTALHSKQAGNLSQEDVKQAAPRSVGQSIDRGETLPSVNTPSEAQSQLQTNSAGTQAQNSPSGQAGQKHLKEDASDKPKIENPQQESIKDFVEKKFKEADNKIEEGKKSISGQEEILQDEYEEDQDKTLLGTATKNLVTSTGKGLLSVGKDVNEAIKKLPPEPPIIFP